MLQVPGRQRVPRHRGQGQRHQREREEPGAVDHATADGRLPRVSSDGHPGDAGDSQEPRHVRLQRRGVAAASAVRPEWRQHAGPDHQSRRAARVDDARGLERSDPGRRAAADAASAAGRERNVVISMWDWADPKAYLHDAVSSDKRNPRVNANGPVYGSLEASVDYLTSRRSEPPHRQAGCRCRFVTRKRRRFRRRCRSASPYWGEEPIWTSRTSAHSFAMDGQGRVWTAQKIRPNETPEFCRPGSSHPSAALFPVSESGRQVSVYDPRSKQFTLVDLCFATHHLAFAEDANNTLWFCSGGGEVVGWLNTKLFDETKDEAKSQGWTAFILDTNGNGRRDAYVEPNQPIDPTKDKRIVSPFLRGHPESGGWIDLGIGAGLPRLRRSAEPRIEPAGDDARRNLRVAVRERQSHDSRLRASRHRHRPQRRRVDRRLERTPGELRPAQVHGAAQRSEGDGQHCAGRMDVLSDAGTAVQGRHRFRERRQRLLQLGRSVQHAGPWRERPDCPGVRRV